MSSRGPNVFAMEHEMCGSICPVCLEGSGVDDHHVPVEAATWIGPHDPALAGSAADLVALLVVRHDAPGVGQVEVGSGRHGAITCSVTGFLWGEEWVVSLKK
jgi:hypothetical protein